MALSPERIRTVFSEHGRRINPALGQNFCVEGALLSAAAARVCLPDLPVLEIGPGLGALTEELLPRAGRVVAVEKDAFLAGLLPQLLPDTRLQVVTGDILRADVPALMGDSPYVVAGNLPYYITTPIVERFLPLLPERMLFMVQKEAAARFFAAPGERVYGAVSVLSQVYYRPEPLFSVPRHCYYPQPEVDSAVVLLTKKAPADLAALPAPDALLRFVRTALAMRRKTLVNNFPRDGRVAALLPAQGIPENVRAETLSPQTLAQLCLLYENAVPPDEI